MILFQHPAMMVVKESGRELVKQLPAPVAHRQVPSFQAIHLLQFPEASTHMSLFLLVNSGTKVRGVDPVA
jgi:hypothetical protein